MSYKILYDFIRAPKRKFTRNKRPRTSSQRGHLRSKIWELRRLLGEALEDGMGKELANALNSLAQHSDDIQMSVIAWVELIEVLVQNAETRYGSKSGRGALKASEVKSVMRYLLRADRLNIPKVPAFIEPVIIDLLVDWSIEVVVSILNESGRIWVTNDPAPRSWTCRLTIPFHWVAKAVSRITWPLWYPLAKLGVYIWQALRYRRPPFRPKLRSALKLVEREGLLFNSK